MRNHYKLFACSISISFLLGGCLGLDKGQNSKEQNSQDRPKDQYESVLTYSGDGYDLPGGEKNEKIAKQHKDEVIKATKDYLKKEYNIDVDVHNMVGNKDGVTVFYESTGPLHFYATAIVPIDSKNKKVMEDKVWTLEGEVEDAIRAALYVYLFEDEFKALDKQVEGFSSEFNLVGRTIESLQNVGGIGYMKPFYFTQSMDLDEAINPVYELYMKNPDASRDQLKRAYKPDLFNPKYFRVSIQFFMEDPKADPDPKVLKELVTTIESNSEIPKGTYSVYLHDNFVDKKSSEGVKKNSLSQSAPDYIIK